MPYCRRMKQRPLVLEERKWYHVVWQTCNRRPLFGVPATRRACEQELRSQLVSHGWTVAAIYVAPAKLHVLAQPPTVAARDSIVREVQRLATVTVRRIGAAQPWAHNLWARNGWCCVLSNAVSVRAVRRYLAERSTSAGAPQMLDVSAGPVH
jgi:REP element-mobilizing transposase RayT